VIEELMKNTVLEGTASACQIDGITVCGKTGTAEVDNEEPHAWFVGYIADESAPYAIAVIVENAGTGAGVAVPIAREVLVSCLEISNE